MHPLDTIKAKHEAKENDWFKEKAVGDVAVSKHDVYVDDVNERSTLWVLLALINTILV